MKNEKPKFLARIKSKNTAQQRQNIKGANQFRYWISIAAHFSQVILVVVAIFGYVFTVRPIYQRDRLEEEVAQLQITIRERTQEAEKISQRIAPLLNEKETLVSQIEKLNSTLSQAQTERDKLNKSLIVIQQNKDELERQMEYMEFKYVLPDGTPAVTEEQVQLAKDVRKKRSEELGLQNIKYHYFTWLSSPGTVIFNDKGEMSLRLGGEMLGGEANNTPFDTYIDIDTSSDLYPFNEDEIQLWKSYANQYPSKAALDTLDKHHNIFLNESNIPSNTLDIWYKEAKEQINKRSRSWTPPYDPIELILEYKTESVRVNDVYLEEVENAEDKYGDWSKSWLPSNRAILKHNYEVSKINAENKNRSDLFLLQRKYAALARELREDLQDEIQYLLSIETELPGSN